MRRFLIVATIFTFICIAVGATIVSGFGGIPLLAGAVPPQPSTATTNSGSKIAVFNMSEVMKNFNKAKRQDDLLNEERKTLMADTASLRAQYTGLQNAIKSEQNAMLKEQLEKRRVEFAQQIEDKDRQITKRMTEKSSAISSSINSDIKTVVDKLAELNGYDIVFAYPDANSDEDMKNPSLKERKPTALQPFFVAKRVDVTDIVIHTLNSWFPPPSSVPIVPAGVQIPNSLAPMK